MVKLQRKINIVFLHFSQELQRTSSFLISQSIYLIFSPYDAPGPHMPFFFQFWIASMGLLFQRQKDITLMYVNDQLIFSDPIYKYKPDKQLTCIQTAD